MELPDAWVESAKQIPWHLIFVCSLKLFAPQPKGAKLRCGFSFWAGGEGRFGEPFRGLLV